VTNGFLLLWLQNCSSKSYGRNSKFLLRVGREQIEHVMTLIKQQLQEKEKATSQSAL
jgi:hypothetical protein